MEVKMIEQNLPAKTNNGLVRKKNQLSVDKWKVSSLKNLPNYRKLPANVFIRQLSNAIPSDHQKIRHWLSNRALFNFIREHTILKFHLSQLQIEQDYWQHLIQMATPAIQWLSGMPKNITKHNSINWDYPRSQRNLQHRQQLMNNKIREAEFRLNKHSEEKNHYYGIAKEYINNFSIDTMDFAISTLIDHDLKKSKQFFENKKSILPFDIKEVELVKQFYSWSPNEQQKYLAQQLWRKHSRFNKRKITFTLKPWLQSNVTFEKKRQSTIQTKTSYQMDTTEIKSEFIINSEDMKSEDITKNFEIQTNIFNRNEFNMETIIQARLRNIEQRAKKILQMATQNDANS
ncbi:unnamed protein product [Rotaria socialis]|uniref:Uncharacterized protein n=1 Tax=Rotaria socialis TaxID=392032 RepID=A0A817Q9P5_9BILA|nr:unnamed protein product [Rotaria socialis]CAF3241316.1 unnamed protein product [Rotaria socialis]CAF3713426.1 unnamed protein product [Rotaria socialis]CAF4453906.1 unnamed protein product [Rotaria socialis]CAF4565623.1 unnamed protein product [Rotaria socialis]